MEGPRALRGRTRWAPSVVRAARGSVSAETALFFGLMNDIHRIRDRALQRHLGQDLRLTETRILLLRYVLLESAAGRAATVTGAQDQRVDVASANSIRAEVALLAEVGVVILERAGIGRGGRTLIWPA